MTEIQDTMENNYSVYQHVTPDGMYYFGQTQNVEQRWSNNGAGYKGTALYPYIEKYGWNNIQHIVLFKDQTKENALWIEDFLITTAREDGVCINQRRSGLVSKDEDYQRGYRQEYREQNKNKIKKYQQEYFQKNKDKKQDYDKKYREQNKQQIQEQKQQYYEENKQQRREYQRQYYQRKKKEKQFKEFGNLPLW